MPLEKKLTEAMDRSGYFSKSCQIKMAVIETHGDKSIILHGKASSWYLRQMAYKIARQVAGNEIKIEDKISVS